AKYRGLGDRINEIEESWWPSSDEGHHTSFLLSFSGKNRKIENNLLKACQSHFFLLFYATINITTTQYVLIVNKLEWNHLLLKQIIHCNLALYHTPKSS
ncbi:MAG: hypothetical protein ACOCPE_10300, partial [Segatella copri]